MKQDDEVKVVFLTTTTQTDSSNENVKKFQEELNEINKKINAKIYYEIINSVFEETKNVHEKRIENMISVLENDSEIYADITFGQKPIPMLLMCVLTFAEKFCNADIKKIIYGKVEFVKHSDGKTYPEKPELYDVTSLYYLNNLVGTMEASSWYNDPQFLEGRQPYFTEDDLELLYKAFEKEGSEYTNQFPTPDNS